MRGRAYLAIENAALRQQVAVLRQNQVRPQLSKWDRIFWVFLRRAWLGWRDALVIVKPDTVVRWHREGVRLLWARKSRRRGPGRRRLDAETRALIRSMALDNGWGAPRIHGELTKLGFDVSERTVSRCLPRGKPTPDHVERWRAFLRNHRDGIAAMDLFTVPTLTFRVLYVLFVIDHGRRRILHVNVTQHPTSAWVIQQLREAFPFDEAPRYLVYDNDAKFSVVVDEFIESIGTRPTRITPGSPWQNGVADRWVGSVRRELLDHVIPLGEQHLLRLLRAYVDYYHADRTHLGLDKDCPDLRAIAPRRREGAEVLALPRVGGLHHRYVWTEAA